MSKLVKQTELELKEKIMDALGRAVADGVLDEAPLPAFIIEVPKERQNGDYSTNVAMAGAKAFHKAPRVIAQAIVDRLDLADTVFDRAEIAGPGFINFFLGNRFYAAVLEDLMAQGENYGRSDYGKGKRVLVEFVSANPTGPMHIGNARGGAIGDCLASVLDWAGYDVQREFYVNDAGNQIEKFATSLEVRYLQHYDPAVELPEDAYKGVDIVEHAENFIKEYGDRYVSASAEERRKALVDYALPKNIAGLERDYLEAAGLQASVAADGPSGLRTALDGRFDLILLDIMLPDGSGLDLLEKLKKMHKRENVIILSAKDSIEDKVLGLELGADDYLPKPFHLVELNARIKSVIRRHQQGGENSIKYGNIEIFPDKYGVTVAGKKLELNRKEYDILVYFMNRPGRLVNKNTLAESVWGDHIDQVDNFDFIYAQIKNLRKHLKEAGATPEVKAVYGLGYKMTMD